MEPLKKQTRAWWKQKTYTVKKKKVSFGKRTVFYETKRMQDTYGVKNPYFFKKIYRKVYYNHAKNYRPVSRFAGNLNKILPFVVCRFGQVQMKEALYLIRVGRVYVNGKQIRHENHVLSDQDFVYVDLPKAIKQTRTSFFSRIQSLRSYMCHKFPQSRALIALGKQNGKATTVLPYPWLRHLIG